MSVESVVQAGYLVAAVLFVLSLAGLSKQETARRGVLLGMTGMGLALAATVALALDRSERPVGVTAGLILLVLLVGAAVGTWRARTVEMTQMPELIALLHSFVGAAAVLVGFGSYLTEPHTTGAGRDRAPRRGVPRRADRRRDLHRLRGGVREAVGAAPVVTADAARPQLAQPGRARRVRRAALVVPRGRQLSGARVSSRCCS